MHLGASVSNFDYEKNNIRKIEIEQTAMLIFDKCTDVDVVLLAGDIFDSGNCSERIAEMIIQKVCNLKNVHFFLACGNHDPYNSTIIRYIRKNAPDNFHVFTPDFQYITLEQLGVRVYGASFESNYCEKSLVDVKIPCDSEYINLLCIHCELTENGKSIYNPVSLSKIELLGFDYAALGHVHSFSGIKRTGTLTYAYPGVHEPNGFDECGKKGYLSGFVSKGFADLTFINCAKREYVDDYIDISDIITLSSLVRAVSEKVTDANIFRYTFTGLNRIGADINCDFISSYANCFYISLVDASYIEEDFASLCDDISLKGLCAREIVNKLENAGPDEKKNILKAGRMLFNILEGKEDGVDY